MPDRLKPKNTGLTDLEMQVYSDFDSIPDLETQILQDTEKLLEDFEIDSQNGEDYKENMAMQKKHLCDKFINMCRLYISEPQNIQEHNELIKKEVTELKTFLGN